MSRFFFLLFYLPFLCPLSADEADLVSTVIISNPRGGVILNQNYAQITVHTNMPQAHWTLLRNNIPVHRGVGPVVNFQTPDGDNYRIVPQELEGYSVRINQPASFRLFPGQTTRISIIYEEAYGSLVIQSPFPSNQVVTLHFKSTSIAPFSVKLISSNGKIYWHSKSLLIGSYEVSYELPENFTPVASESFIIRLGAQTELSPQLFTQGTIRVLANIPDAVYVLRSLKDSQVRKGEGREYNFRETPPGTYLLSFSTQKPDYYIPPRDMYITLNELENREVKVNFQSAGKLTISTNVDRADITIKELGGQGKVYQDQVVGKSKGFTLSEGRYRILLSLPKGELAASSAPASVDVVIKALGSKELNLPFNEGDSETLTVPPQTSSKEKQLQLTVSSNISSGGFSVYKTLGGKQEFVGHFTGKNVQITLPAKTRYELTFDEVPNYKTPEKMRLSLDSVDKEAVQVFYIPQLAMITIPAGKAIVGAMSSLDIANELPAKVINLSRYSIGTYEVNNAQYAAWLNQAIKNNKLVYISEADQRGQVIDLEGHLVFKTFEADIYSQIFVQQRSENTPIFLPIAGKDNYPVIDVSWHGAIAYCKDNQCRLPTEAEWEKAAGMEPEVSGQPLKKYLFGFGSDKINSTFANYKVSDSAIQTFQVLTTPVGFYNGVNFLPLSIQHPEQQRTHLAKSPYGAFDMSGNVWEWVADWYDVGYVANMSDVDPQGPSTGLSKVVKGGCYDSLADGVRVTERLGLPLEYADAYTGFRVAQD